MIGRKFVGSLKQSYRFRLVIAEGKIGQLSVSLDMVGVQLNTAAECSDRFFVIPLVVEEVPEQVERSNRSGNRSDACSRAFIASVF